MKSKYCVLTATRADEGIRLAKTQKPDLILLDIMMPGMAGTQVAEELSADPDTTSIPIILSINKSSRSSRMPHLSAAT